MTGSPYRRLVLIGNGFDRWQGLPTSYDQFRRYYADHLEEALHALGIPGKTAAGRTVTPVELVYGDPFDPAKLPSEFFWTFETSLDKLDDQQLNLYFGRDGISALRETVAQAQRILRHLFSGWVLALAVEGRDGGRRFGDDCFFVSFNYTDTLEKRFGVDPRRIYHIHGDAGHPASIVFDHATHPETAFRELIDHRFLRPLHPDQGLPRLAGLYAVEDALYRTDKHVADRIDALCRALWEAGVHMEDIEDIYVLGHSFGDPDVEYFDFLNKATRRRCDYDALSAAARLDRRRLARLMSGDARAMELLLEEIRRNLRYAEHHRERKLGREPIPFPPRDDLERAVLLAEAPYDRRTAGQDRRSVRQRFLWEQAGRTQAVLRELARAHGLPEVPAGCRSVLGLADYLDGGHAPRRRDAGWHISYLTKDDQRRIERVMRRIGAGRYRLYEGIDRCMEAMRQTGTCSQRRR